MFAQGTTTQSATSLEHEAHTEVRIDAMGRVTVEGKNYTGDACSILGDKLRRAFGGGGSKTDKPEAFASDYQQVNEGPNW